MRLLIAHSNPTLASACEVFFENDGYDVETVGDGLGCVTAARLRLPDVLILDYDLLWGGGDGVLACLHEEFSFRPIPVVLLTSDQVERGRVDQLESLVSSVLQHPFRLSRLADVVHAAVGRGPTEPGQTLFAM